MLFSEFKMLFSDFAVEAEWLSTSEIAKVIFDRPDEVMLGNVALAGNEQLIFPATSFFGIDEGDEVRIANVDWVLRETPRHSLDGRVMTVSIEKQTGNMP